MRQVEKKKLNYNTKDFEARKQEQEGVNRPVARYKITFKVSFQNNFSYVVFRIILVVAEQHSKEVQHAVCEE